MAEYDEYGNDITPWWDLGHQLQRAGFQGSRALSALNYQWNKAVNGQDSVGVDPTIGTDWAGNPIPYYQEDQQLQQQIANDPNVLKTTSTIPGDYNANPGKYVSQDTLLEAKKKWNYDRAQAAQQGLPEPPMPDVLKNYMSPAPLQAQINNAAPVKRSLVYNQNNPPDQPLNMYGQQIDPTTTKEYRDKKAQFDNLYNSINGMDVNISPTAVAPLQRTLLNNAYANIYGPQRRVAGQYNDAVDRNAQEAARVQYDSNMDKLDKEIAQQNIINNLDKSRILQSMAIQNPSLSDLTRMLDSATGVQRQADDTALRKTALENEMAIQTRNANNQQASNYGTALTNIGLGIANVAAGNNGKNGQDMWNGISQGAQNVGNFFANTVVPTLLANGVSTGSNGTSVGGIGVSGGSTSTPSSSSGQPGPYANQPAYSPNPINITYPNMQNNIPTPGPKKYGLMSTEGGPLQSSLSQPKKRSSGSSQYPRGW